MQAKAPTTPQTKAPAPAGDAVRATNNRRLYLKMRIEELRAELTRLSAERKALLPPQPKAK